MPKAGVRGNVSVPSAKKARVHKEEIDPITEKVHAMMKAFEDEQQGGLVEMPAPMRAMLLSVMESALGKNAAKDERQEFQTSVADVIGDSFKQAVKIWEGKVGEANALVEGAHAAKVEKEAVRLAAVNSLEEIIVVLNTSEASLDAAVEAVSAATTALADTQRAVDNGDAERQAKQDDRNRASVLLKDHFEVLKSGEGNKSLVKPLAQLLKELNAEASLVSAMGSTFGKKPENRGQFDNMVVQQLEEVLTSHIKEVDNFLSNFETISAERASAVDEKKAALEAAEQQKATCQEAAEAARGNKYDCEEALQEAQTFLEEFEGKLEEKKAEVAVQESFLNIAKENLENFLFLYDRVQAVPETAIEAEASPEAATTGGDSELAV